MAHTPGPWKVYRTKDGTAILGIGDADAGGITDANFGLWRSDQEREANAYLIAAAPDLLGTLKELEEVLDDLADADDGRPNNEMKMLVIVRKAIAKAEGRS